MTASNKKLGTEFLWTAIIYYNNQNIALILLQHRTFYNNLWKLRNTHSIFQRKIIDFLKFLNY